MKVGSLFAGIGGIDLGLERAGMTTAWQVEFEPLCRRVLAHHWPEALRHDDVRTFDPAAFPWVDLIAGGFPCQPHSVAGKRKADQDERDLWGEFARIVGEARPRWVLGENVPGLLSSLAVGRPDRFFGRVLSDLAALGYCVGWGVLRASDVGAHHRRARVFLVAHACGQQGRQRCGRHTSELGASMREARARNEGYAALGCDGPNVDNTNGQREPQPCGLLANLWGRLGDSRGWQAEPRVGGGPDGLPSWLDGLHNRAAWADGSWEAEIPRQSIKSPRRDARLKMLGNAVVPDCAELIGKAIMAIDRATPPTSPPAK